MPQSAQAQNHAAVLQMQDLAHRLRRAGEKAPEALDRVCLDAARKIYAEMLRRVPVDTGRLKGSIIIKVGHHRWTIGPVGVPYAPYVEFGTGARSEFGGQAYTIKPKSSNGKLVFEIGGRKVFAREVRHPGIRPKPYVRPAAREYLKTLGENAAHVGVSLIQGRNV